MDDPNRLFAAEQDIEAPSCITDSLPISTTSKISAAGEAFYKLKTQHVLATCPISDVMAGTFHQLNTCCDIT